MMRLGLELLEALVTLQVARELGVQTKTAWRNLIKLREALAARRGRCCSKARSRSTACI
jgi:hypothetical protein